MIIIILFSLIIFTSASNIVYGHGVVYEVKKDKTVIIKVEYDDGEPMSYAEVEIFSPKDKKIEYQNGRTDKNGCFAFLPDEVGEWKIKVNDGMGHGVVTKVPIEEGMKIDVIRHGFPRWQKLIIGISIIFGMTGFVSYFKLRKKIT